MGKKKTKRTYKRRWNIRIGATAGFIAFLSIMWHEWKVHSEFPQKARAMFQRLTGYNWDTGEWKWKDATAGMSLGGGCLISWLGAKSKTNRYLPTFGPISINW